MHFKRMASIFRRFRIQVKPFHDSSKLTLTNGLRPFSTEKEDFEYFFYRHFRKNKEFHPLNPRKELAEANALPHPIWTKEELDSSINNLHYHKPSSISDYLVYYLRSGLYLSFNFFSGYNEQNPTVESVKRRLIIVESVASIPSFIAATFRHFGSIWSLRKDYGWLPALLEEAENERMHLIICLDRFETPKYARVLIYGAQFLFAPMVFFIYLVNPKTLYRFNGYLEETACRTYSNIIRKIELPHSRLNQEWSQLDSPEIARKYYNLPKGTKWAETLRCMLADEAHHRDVSHTFANMHSDDPNPFVERYQDNARSAWRSDEESDNSDKPKSK